MRVVKVLLVDDHELLRSGLEKILESDQSLKVVGSLASAEEVLVWVRKNTADVMLIDLELPAMSGLELIRRLKKIDFEQKLIVLSVHANVSMVQRAFQAKALGYLTKGSGATEVMQAIHEVAAGRSFISSDLAQKVALSQLSDNYAIDPLRQLTHREWQILDHTLKGKKAIEVAQSLYLSVKTVNSYRYRIFKKLGVKNNLGLFKCALSLGWHAAFCPEAVQDEWTNLLSTAEIAHGDKKGR